MAQVRSFAEKLRDKLYGWIGIPTGPAEENASATANQASPNDQPVVSECESSPERSITTSTKKETATPTNLDFDLEDRSLRRRGQVNYDEVKRRPRKKSSSKRPAETPPTASAKKPKVQSPLDKKYPKRGTKPGVYPKKSLWKYVENDELYIVEVVTGNVSKMGNIEVKWTGFNRRSTTRVPADNLQVLTDRDVETFDREMESILDGEGN